ncbi:uncharacterized protein LOC124371751, partial [Homalodisca vitripennis]|uniref:uncharacterized protein LOC124371751 n=1 Tax=Homalodisca vitripennis TaxID=197043 RepID=UPI001EEAF666
MSLLAELAISEPQDFKNYLRMSEESFEYLFGRLCEHIEKEDSLLRTSIPAKERLAATLQFLASGRSYENLKFSCAISPQALGKIIPETCAAIFDVLKEDFLKFPCNESDWMNIAVDFKKYWQVENCVGAIDGKHIAIRQPPKSGSYYYNYKGCFWDVPMSSEPDILGVSEGGIGINIDSDVSDSDNMEDDEDFITYDSIFETDEESAVAENENDVYEEME